MEKTVESIFSETAPDTVMFAGREWEVKKGDKELRLRDIKDPGLKINCSTKSMCLHEIKPGEKSEQ